MTETDRKRSIIKFPDLVSVNFLSRQRKIENEKLLILPHEKCNELLCYTGRIIKFYLYPVKLKTCLWVPVAK